MRTCYCLNHPIRSTCLGTGLLVTAILTASLACSAQVFVQPAGDARIEKILPTMTDGTSVYLSVYSLSNNIQRSVVQFNLPALSANAVITNATLKLFADANLYPTGNPTGQSMEVYRLTRPWVETRVSWANAARNVAWTTPGGDYVGTTGLPNQKPYASNSTVVPDNYTNLSPVELDWNVTGLVQEWYAGTHPNYGLLLLSYPGNGLLFHSRESSANVPVLEIDTTNSAPVSSGNPPSSDVLTYHNDNARTGQNLHEEILSPGNIDVSHFGKLWVYPADGKVDAQPLYAAGVSIPGRGLRNVVFIATEHDTVYAYDADSTNKFWQVSMLGAGETPSDARGCDQVVPEIGVTATPVIDRHLGTNGTIFVVAMSMDIAGNYYQRVHALDLATGAHRLPPVAVAATYPGSGANNDGTNVLFDPAQYKERPGLLLLNGVVYTAWSSHCDFDPYTGWIIGYDEHTLARTNVFNFTPNGTEGSVWMSGAGMAVDGSNNIYFLAANGTFDSTLTTNGFPSQGDYGNAFIKLSTTGNTLAVADYFATFTNAYENSVDLDLGSGGALVLPDMIDVQGHTRQLAVGAGKDGNLYLVDRSNMGKFNPNNNNAIYQELGKVFPNGVYSMPAYFNGALYYGGVGQAIQAFPFLSARLGAISSETPTSFGYPGATPSVSGNVNSNGIVWATENQAPAVLHAYAATDLANELYNSEQAANGSDEFGDGNKFITPTIASARVYVATTTGVGAFGLLDQSTLTSLQVWRDNHFGNPSNVGGGADGASPAGDGVANLIKYALGLDPLTPAPAAALPAGSITEDPNQLYPTLTVNRTAQAPDISYVVEVSGDLHNWFSGTAYTTTLVDTATQLIVRDNTPVGPSPRFMRLAITSP